MSCYSGRYSDGAYYGVASESGYTTYPNGWGVFSWESDNSFRMTRYSGLKETNSPGIYITSDYTVGVGKLTMTGICRKALLQRLTASGLK